jgi:hypothetical protein
MPARCLLLSCCLLDGFNLCTLAGGRERFRFLLGCNLLALSRDFGRGPPNPHEVVPDLARVRLLVGRASVDMRHD